MATPFERTFKIGRGKPTPKPPEVKPPTPKPESKLSKNPLVREIRRQGGKVRELAEKPGQETFRQEVLRQPRYPKQLPENFSTYQVLVQEFDDLDKKVLGFSTAGDINAVPKEIQANPKFQEYWKQRAEFKKGRQQQLDNKRAMMESVATMEQNRQAGMERENLTPEESKAVKESIALPGKVQDVAYGFSRDPEMAGKSDASLAADSIMYAIPDFWGGNMSGLALRAGNAGKAYDEIDPGQRAMQTAFNFGASLVGAVAMGGANIGIKAGLNAARGGMTAKGLSGATRAIMEARTLAKGADVSARVKRLSNFLGIDAVKAAKLYTTGAAAGRFTLMDLPGYGKMLADNNGDAGKATKMFWDSTFGQYAKFDTLFDPNVPIDQKVATVTGMIGAGLIAVGTSFGAAKGYDHIKQRFVNKGAKGLGSAFDPTATLGDLSEIYDPSKPKPTLDQGTYEKVVDPVTGRTTEVFVSDNPLSLPEPKPVDAAVAVDTLLGKGNLSRIEALSPDDIEVDPKMQHRPMGTNKVGDGTPFNITQADKITVFRTKDGRNIVGDGHHRLEIAKNATEFIKQEPDGTSTPADRTVMAEVLNEADGWTFEQVRNMAAVRNMVGGTISPFEAALAVNRMGLDLDALAKQGLKPHHSMSKEVKGLLNLDPMLLEEMGDSVLGINADPRASRFASAIGTVDGLNPALQREALKNALSDRSNAQTDADAIQIANDVKNGAMTKAVKATQRNIFDDEPEPDIIEVPYDIMNAIRKRVRDTVRGQYNNIVAKLKGDTRGGEVIDVNSRQADKANLGGSAEKAVGRATQAMTSGMWNGGRNPIEAMVGEVAKLVDKGEMTIEAATQQVLDRVLTEITGSDKDVMNRQMKAPDVSRETSTIDDLPDSNITEAQGGLGLFALGGNVTPPPVTRVGDSLIVDQTAKPEVGRSFNLQGLTQLQDQLGPNGEIVRQGALSRVFGEIGSRMSRALFDASKRNMDYRAPYIKMLNSVDEALSLETRSRGSSIFKRGKTFDDVQREFVDIAELPFDDPKRIAIKESDTNMGEALRRHDELTQGVKRMIVQGKILDGSIRVVDEEGNPVPPQTAAMDDAMVDAATEEYGITDRGYFHHSWLGNTSVHVRNADGTTTIIGEGLKTFTEAEFLATKYANENPGSRIEIRGRDRYSTSSGFKPEVTRGKFFGKVAEVKKKLIQDLRDSGMYDSIDDSGNVVIDFNDMAKDVVGSVVTIGKPRRKFNKATMTRDTAINPLGKQGYSKDYRAVMDSYIANSARSRNLTELSAAMKPLIDSIKLSPDWNDKAKRAVEIFEEKVIGDIWGTPTRVDDAVADLLTSTGLDKFTANPTTWASSASSALTSFQYLARLRFSPKQWALNAQQTLQLIPDIGGKAYKAAVSEVLDSYRGKNSTVKDLKDRGVLSAAVHAEDVNPFRKGWKSTDINANISEYNRAVGYVVGRNKAIEAGITDPDKIHDSGLQWATRAEGDASVYNKPVAFRGPINKTATQFKSFTVHQLRDIFQMQEGESKKAFRKRALGKLGIIGLTGGAKALSPSASKFVTAYAMFKLSEKLTEAGINEEYQDELFATFNNGLPAAFGVDISGSMGILDTFGDNLNEIVGTTLGGPTLGAVSGMIERSSRGKPAIDGVTPYAKMGRAATGMDELDSPWERVMQTLNIPLMKKSIGYNYKDAKKGGEFVNAVLKPFKLSIDPDVENRKKKREVRAKREKRETR
jgi:hypothetical protein